MITSYLAFASVGAITGAIITVFSTHSLKNRELKVKILEEKINKLYGPIYYFLKQNEFMFDQNGRIHISLVQEYIDSDNPERIEEAMNDTTYIKQSYQDLILENNKQIKQIVDNNFSLIDVDDIEIFLQFFLHHTRLLIEIKNEEKIRIPYKVKKNLEDISLMPKDFFERINKKFESKKKELKTISEKKWWLLWLF